MCGYKSLKTEIYTLKLRSCLTSWVRSIPSPLLSSQRCWRICSGVSGTQGSHLLCFPIRGNSSCIDVSGEIATLQPVFRPYLTLGFLPSSVTFAALCSTGASKSSEKGGMDSSRTAAGINTWPPPVNHECSLWHHKWQSLSMKFSTWFDALEKELSVLATTFKMCFLNKLQKLKITVWSLGHRIGALYK